MLFKVFKMNLSAILWFLLIFNAVKCKKDSNPSYYSYTVHSQGQAIKKIENPRIYVLQSNGSTELLRKNPLTNSSKILDRILGLQKIFSFIPYLKIRSKRRNRFGREPKSLSVPSRFEEQRIPDTSTQNRRTFIPNFSIAKGTFSNRFLQGPMMARLNQRIKSSFLIRNPVIRHFMSNHLHAAESGNNLFYAPHPHQGFLYGDSSVNRPARYRSPIHVGDVAKPWPYGDSAISTNNRQVFLPLQTGVYAGPNFTPDLMTSGSAVRPHLHLASLNPNHASYISQFPRHKPLFNNVGGLKGTALEISNAFADFTDSSEHGPEVTQKFGSVGHTINTFLNMMGLGPSGGLDSGIGGFGGGGDWASMDNTPIARSSDFYPGYGNQANLDDIGDFPVFYEDITEQFLRKMNLTDVLAKMVKSKDVMLKNENKTIKSEFKAVKHPLKNDIEEVIKTDFMVIKYPPQPRMPTNATKATSISAMAHKSSEKIETEKEKIMKKPNNVNHMPKLTTEKNSKSITKEIIPTKSPIVNYKIPSVLSPVSPKDRRKPIAVFMNIDIETPTSNNKGTKEIAYAPAHPMHDHKEETNVFKLIDDNIVRSWIPITNGKGYVEKHPKPIIDVIGTDSEEHKGLKILKKLLADEKNAQL